MLTITTTEIFEEIAAIFDVDRGAERQLKGILMQLGDHIVIDDFREEEWERRSHGQGSNAASKAI